MLLINMDPWYNSNILIKLWDILVFALEIRAELEISSSLVKAFIAQIQNKRN